MQLICFKTSTFCNICIVTQKACSLFPSFFWNACGSTEMSPLSSKAIPINHGKQNLCSRKYFRKLQLIIDENQKFKDIISHTMMEGKFCPSLSINLTSATLLTSSDTHRPKQSVNYMRLEGQCPTYQLLLPLNAEISP